MSGKNQPNTSLHLPETMTNYIFIHDGIIMNGAANVLVLSLLDEFLSIASCKELIHNIEISQYFVIGEIDNSCINCEIVLRYSNTVIPSKGVEGTGQKYYFVDANNLDGRKIGLIELFVKKIYDKNITFERIDIVKIVDKLEDYSDSFYIYSDKLDSVKKISDRAICRCLTDALNATYDSGEITCGDASKLSDLTAMTKELVNQSVSSSQKLQNLKLSGKNEQSMIGSSPSDHMTHLIRIVDQTVQSIEESKKSILNPNMDIVSVLAPNESMLEFDIGSIRGKQMHIYLSISAVVAVVRRSTVLASKDKRIRELNSTVYGVSVEAIKKIPQTIPSAALKPCRKCEQISSIVTDIVQMHRKKLKNI